MAAVTAADGFGLFGDIEDSRLFAFHTVGDFSRLDAAFELAIFHRRAAANPMATVHREERSCI
jgi:hypothetical protein